MQPSTDSDIDVTDPVYLAEDFDRNLNHDLPEDLERRQSGRAISHKDRQLRLAEGWLSVLDSIYDSILHYHT